MASTLFGKPRSEVIKHPGAFSSKAKAAGKSTSEFAREKKHAGGEAGREANLAITLGTLRRHKAKFGGVYEAMEQPAKPKGRVRFGG